MLVDDNFAVVDHYHSLSERFDKPYTKGGILGSIADQRFRNMWFSEANKAGLHAVNPSEHCQHHCIAENKNRMLLDFLRTDSDHAAFV